MGTKALSPCEGGDNQTQERTFFIRISMGIYGVPKSIYPSHMPFLLGTHRLARRDLTKWIML